MRIGVVGNGAIVRRMLGDIRELADVEAVAICVRPQSWEWGQKLADAYGMELVYTDYGEFLRQGDFDTVYLGISNHVHVPYAKAALEAGKHVICEKPMTLTGKEARELAELARGRGLFLWEASKIPYSPIFQKVREALPQIGELRMIQCNYSRISSRYKEFMAGETVPAFDPSCGGGSLYDINYYNLHIVTALFGQPETVTAMANYGRLDADTSSTVLLGYPGFYAVCTAAKDSNSPSFVVFQGTGGYIRIDGPVSSAKRAELVMPDGQVWLAEDPHAGRLTGELAEFARQLREDDRKACDQGLERTVILSQVMEKAAGQIHG